MKHIGMDVHSTTTDICVLNSRGREILHRRLPSTETDLVDFMLTLRGPKRVTIEESQMADWVARALIPHVDEMIRCLPQHNRLITGSENKNDRQDARSLAELLYLNRLKAVHHPEAEFQRLREVVRAYWYSSRELTRSKNRLKAYFLFNGVHCRGDSVYGLRKRGFYYEQLEHRGANLELAQILYKRLDQSREAKAQHVRLLRQQVTPELKEAVRCLKSIPGIGFIGACTLVAYLERGWRFPNKNKLWKYGGLAIRERLSRDVGHRGSSRSGNRYVKQVLMTAVESLAKRTDGNALTRQWRLGQESGTDYNRLRRNMARKVAVIAHCLLRTGERYRDELVNSR